MKRLSKTRRRAVFFRILVDTRASRLSWSKAKQVFRLRVVGNRRAIAQSEAVPADGLSERALYAAVLVRASQDYLRWEELDEEDISEEAELLGREALWWFMQADDELVLVWDAVVEDVVVDWVPYRWICTVLDLDADAYFQKLRRKAREYHR